MSEEATTGVSREGVTRRQLVAALASSILFGLLAAFLYWFFMCPCERLPGAYLLGEVNEQPVSDWSFANQVSLCQIQIDGGILPHALNLNCMAADDGALYLSCSSCDGKRWSTKVQENPSGRIRLDDTVYPVTITRVMEPAEMDLSWQARSEKLARLAGEQSGAAPPRPDHWWTFRVQSSI